MEAARQAEAARRDNNLFAGLEEANATAEEEKREEEEEEEEGEPQMEEVSIEQEGDQWGSMVQEPDPSCAWPCCTPDMEWEGVHVDGRAVPRWCCHSMSGCTAQPAHRASAHCLTSLQRRQCKRANLGQQPSA